MPKKPAEAFEKYAHEYDLITNAAKRETYHAKEIAAMVERFEPERVLDAGCATGLTTYLFAKQGIESVGIDRSRRMVEVAKGKFADTDLPMSFRHAAFERLPKMMHNRFDMVVCLANAITGVGSKQNLNLALKNFQRVLRPGGALVIQILNYSAIAEGELMPIRATENNGIVWLRYSRRQGRRLSINVVRLDTRQHPPIFEPFFHEFDNFDLAEIETALKRTGFADLKRYRDLYMQRPFIRKSRDLVVTARHR